MSPQQLLQKLTGIALMALGALVGIAHAAEMTEAEMVRQLSAVPAAPSSDSDPDLEFDDEGGPSGKSVRRTRRPDTNGACLADQDRGGSQKAMVVIALAPSGAPQINMPLQFALNSHVLSTTDQRQLDTLARAMNNDALRTARFTVSGHTDAVGDAVYNEKLSCARALSARTYLMERGVAAERLTAYGFGSSRPIEAVSGSSAKNRRVEIRRAEN
ncbi:MAG: OmpA family protein [Rhodoferax sp.]|nr:OmpA family protein [Rhodoferax sp.]